MDAILVHGMGRTPVSMMILAARLLASGIHPHLFAYTAALENMDRCGNRLKDYVKRRSADRKYILIGHSLGAVLIRAVLPQLETKPAACFLLAPPSRACQAAVRLAPFRLYRLLTGEMGQRLAAPAFMASLPIPEVPTRIYAGTSGPRNIWSPFCGELNDGILAISETSLASIPVQTVASLHTFIMNARTIADDIRAFTNSLEA